MANGNGFNWSGIMDFAARLAVPIVLASGATSISHAIQLSELRLRVASLESREIPPGWLRDKVESIERRQEEIVRNQGHMLQRLAVLENGK